MVNWGQCSSAGIPICSWKRSLRQPDPQDFDGLLTKWTKIPMILARSRFDVNIVPSRYGKLIRVMPSA
jgi:hypothetical protein